MLNEKMLNNTVGRVACPRRNGTIFERFVEWYEVGQSPMECEFFKPKPVRLQSYVPPNTAQRTAAIIKPFGRSKSVPYANTGKCSIQRTAQKSLPIGMHKCIPENSVNASYAAESDTRNSDHRGAHFICNRWFINYLRNFPFWGLLFLRVCVIIC